MIGSRCLLLGSCAVLLVLGTIGCSHKQIASPSDLAAAQQDFLQAFLTAHNKKDLEAQKALVDWDNITDESRDHYLRAYVESNVDTTIKSASIEDIPGLTARFGVTYNIPPEKFLVVVYADPRGDTQIKYPIGRKADGRYYFALTGLTREAIKSNNERFRKSGQ